MTPDKILRQVSDKTALSDGAGTPERTFLFTALNEGLRQVLLDTRCTVAPVTINLTTGTTEYDLTSYSILATVDYTNVADNFRTLVNTNGGQILARRLWGTAGEARRFALFGGNILIVDPAPSEDTTFIFYAVVQPSDIVDGDTDDLIGLMPSFALKAVEWWMCVEASQKNKDFNAVQYYTSLYDKEVIKVRKRVRQLAGRRMPGGVIGYPERPNIPPHDNSFDDGC